MVWRGPGRPKHLFDICLKIVKKTSGSEVFFSPIPKGDPWTVHAQGGATADGTPSVLRAASQIAAELAAVGANGTRPIAIYGAWDKGYGDEGRLLSPPC